MRRAVEHVETVTGWHNGEAIYCIEKLGSWDAWRKWFVVVEHLGGGAVHHHFLDVECDRLKDAWKVSLDTTSHT